MELNRREAMQSVLVSGLACCVPITADGESLYQEMGSIPIFSEHNNWDGTKYAPRVLRAMAETCNQRIKEYGEPVPVVVCETDEVLGHADAFSVREVAGKASICCHLSIAKDRVEKFMQHKLMGVDLWVDDLRPEDRYFDSVRVTRMYEPLSDAHVICNPGYRRSTLPPTI